MCAGSRRYSRRWSSPGSTGVRECFLSMDDFPEFMKHSANPIAMSNHDYDEYMLVVQGQYTLLVDGKQIPLRAGEEYFIPRGVLHGGEVLAGTRTIHAFGGHRAERVREP